MQPGCAHRSGRPSTRPLAPSSPLQLRQLQSRAFEGADARLVLKAALDALQDEGYVIREADAELGLVTGVMEWQSQKRNGSLHFMKWVAALPTYGASLLVPSGRDEFSAVEANVNAILCLAEVELEAQRWTTAREHLDRAAEIVGDAPEPPTLGAEIAFGRARIALHEGQRARARSLATSALATYREAGEGRARAAADVEAWLDALP